jgi:hypothetical protein
MRPQYAEFLLYALLKTVTISLNTFSLTAKQLAFPITSYAELPKKATL